MQKGETRKVKERGGGETGERRRSGRLFREEKERGNTGEKCGN